MHKTYPNKMMLNMQILQNYTNKKNIEFSVNKNLLSFFLKRYENANYMFEQF